MTRRLYDELLRDLFPRVTGGIRWGLDRTRRLLAAVGDPHRAYPVIHVGGTNGKGSVAACLAAIFDADGHRSGLYTSPHLCSFRERIRVGGEPVTEEAVIAAAERLRPAVARERPSFFEATTAIGFLAMAEAGCDVAVVEVGLGGRLDATNVVDPVAVALTNVALDHAEYLGDSIPAVAAEKAGIMKPGVPVITAELEPAVLEVFRRRARQLSSPLHLLPEDAVHVLGMDLHGTRFRTRLYGEERTFETPLVGRHQARNAALGIRLLELLPAPLQPASVPVRTGIANVIWPGRFQVEEAEGRTWILDGAHNPEEIAALVATLEDVRPPRPLVAVIGILGDKDWSAMLPPVFDVADHVVLTRPASAPADRAWDPAAVLARFPTSSARAVPALDDALGAAIAESTAAAGGAILVAGSFHTVGDVLARLERAPWGVDSDLQPLAAGA